MDTRDEDELKAEVDEVLKDYEESIEAVLQKRDTRLREIKERRGLKQADLVRVTGYSRETIRQALNPEIRAQVKAQRAARDAAKQQDSQP